MSKYPYYESEELRKARYASLKSIEKKRCTACGLYCCACQSILEDFE